MLKSEWRNTTRAAEISYNKLRLTVAHWVKAEGGEWEREVVCQACGCHYSEMGFEAHC